MSEPLSPAFTDPHAAQRCFRLILDAMSHPGRIYTLLDPLVPPKPLSPAAASCLLTLTDAMTAIALPDDAAAWLAFHTGAQRASPSQADFIVACGPVKLGDFSAGTDEAPERGATLLLEVLALDIGSRVRLSGPGIADPLITALPLEAHFIEQWRQQHDCAPCGVDVILCAGQTLLALPRSVMIERL